MGGTDWSGQHSMTSAHLNSEFMHDMASGLWILKLASFSGKVAECRAVLTNSRPLP